MSWVMRIDTHRNGSGGISGGRELGGWEVYWTDTSMVTGRAMVGITRQGLRPAAAAGKGPQGGEIRGRMGTYSWPMRG